MEVTILPGTFKLIKEPTTGSSYPDRLGWTPLPPKPMSGTYCSACGLVTSTLSDTERAVEEFGLPESLLGQIVVSSLRQSYCYNANFPTITPSTTTAITTAPTTTSPSPTVYIERGVLTYGTRSDDGNGDYCSAFGDAEHAINTSCGNLTNNATPIVFKPGSDTNELGVYVPPDNVEGPILVGADWNFGGRFR